MKNEDILRMYDALKRIATKYQTPDQLRRNSEADWGLDYEEALEMTYENVIQEAKNGIRGIRIKSILPNPPKQ